MQVCTVSDLLREGLEVRLNPYYGNDQSRNTETNNRITETTNSHKIQGNIRNTTKDIRNTETPQTATYFGKLCKRGHDHNGQGQSERFKSSGNCKDCKIIDQKERRNTKPRTFGVLCKHTEKCSGYL